MLQSDKLTMIGMMRRDVVISKKKKKKKKTLLGKDHSNVFNQMSSSLLAVANELYSRRTTILVWLEKKKVIRNVILNDR